MEILLAQSAQLTSRTEVIGSLSTGKHAQYASVLVLPDPPGLLARTVISDWCPGGAGGFGKNRYF